MIRVSRVDGSVNVVVNLSFLSSTNIAVRVVFKVVVDGFSQRYRGFVDSWFDRRLG